MNIKLRNLKPEDADKMLEWMHDPYVVDKLRTDFSVKTREDCIEFIENCIDKENINLAISDEEGVYLGTISLRHITGDSAEFAITIGREAMGKGIAIKAMRMILKKGFEEMGLKYIYWCVAKDNTRALRFYDKNGFERIRPEHFKDEIKGYTEDQIRSYIWYSLTNEM